MSLETLGTGQADFDLWKGEFSVEAAPSDVEVRIRMTAGLAAAESAHLALPLVERAALEQTYAGKATGATEGHYKYSTQ